MKKQLDALGKLKVPSASSYFGIVDLCGFKKDRFYIYQARWRPDLPMAHILPHWNWPERVGQVTPVHVYTSGDEAELFQDGKSLGRKKRGKFDTACAGMTSSTGPGRSRSSPTEGQGVGAGQGEDDRARRPAPALGRSADDPRRRPGSCLRHGGDRRPRGATVPRSHNLVQFEVDGPGEIVAVGNGDATSHEPFQAASERRTTDSAR